MFPKKNELNLRISDGFTAVESLAGVTGATPSLPLTKLVKKKFRHLEMFRLPFMAEKLQTWVSSSTRKLSGSVATT